LVLEAYVIFHREAGAFYKAIIGLICTWNGGNKVCMKRFGGETYYKTTADEKMTEFNLVKAG
jgi:hypothetical protein